jgi:ATP/maltotriose-dependent transcriptional regulator MalT
LRAAAQHFRAGSLLRARMAVKSVIESVPAGTRRCVALMLLAAVEGYGDDLLTAVDALTMAADEADEPVVRLQALLLLTPAEGLTGNLEKSVKHADAAVALAEKVGVPALLSQALAISATVRFIYGLGADPSALHTALDHEQPDSAAAATYQATAVAAVIAGWTGDLLQARDVMGTVKQHYTDRGSEADTLWAAYHAVMFDVWLGRFADASRTAEDAMLRAEQMGGHHVLIKARTGVAAVAAYTADVDVARAAAQAAISAAHNSGGRYLAIEPSTSLAFIEVSLGDYAAARALLEPLLAQFDPAHGTELVVGGFLPDAIETLCALGTPTTQNHWSRPSNATEPSMIGPGCSPWAPAGAASCSRREAISTVLNAPSSKRWSTTSGCQCPSNAPAPNCCWASCSAAAAAANRPPQPPSARR